MAAYLILGWGGKCGRSDIICGSVFDSSLDTCPPIALTEKSGASISCHLVSALKEEDDEVPVVMEASICAGLAKASASPMTKVKETRLWVRRE